MCKKQLGYNNAKHVYVLEPGMNMDEGLFLVQDDEGIWKVLSMISADTNVVDFLATHGIDAPVFTPDVSTVSYDLPQPAMDESIANDNDTLNPDAEPGDDINEVDDVIMESEDSENDDYEEGSED